MNSDAGSDAGNPATSVIKASTPPAEAPNHQNIMRHRILFRFPLVSRFLSYYVMSLLKSVCLLSSECTLVCLFQFLEPLLDHQAAEAVHSRIDRMYVAGAWILEWTRRGGEGSVR